MQCNAKWRVPIWSGLITCLAFGLVAALGATQKPAPKKNLKVHIVTWAKDAKLSRKLTEAEIKTIKAARKKDDKRPIPAYKTVAGVKSGASLEVPDILETKKQIVAIQGGELTYTKLAPNTKLKYVTINPTSMVRSKPAELHVSIEKGKGQFRVGTLAQSSVIKAMGPMLATAAKGTAYSVAVQGQKTTLVVAEGQVEIYMESAPGAAITVSPREKVVYTAGDPFPEQAVDIAPAEEQEIRELLSLPVQNLFGYESGRDIRRPDAENIVVTNVEYINRSVDTGSMNSYKPSWKTPERVYFTGRDNFWTTDAAGTKTNAGKGFYFEGLSPDGKTIFASKPNAGLWRMDWSGTNKVQVTKKSVGGVVSIAPNGQRLVAQEGWHQVPIQKWDAKKKKMVSTGKNRWVTKGDKFVAVNVSGRTVKDLSASADKARWAKAFWRGGGSRLIVGLTLEKGSKFVDADISPVKDLVSTDFFMESWYVSPGSKWLYGPGGPKWQQDEMKFVRLSDGRVFTHPSSASGFLLVGENNFLVGSKVIEIENPGSAGRDMTSEDQTYPDVISRLDISPNGEILAYQGSEAPYLASFADSLNLSRFSTTAVAASRLTERVSWLSGSRVLYETWGWDKVRNQILTLGVKRKSSAKEANESPTNSTATVASFPVAGLLGATHQDVEAKLGPPAERSDFNSLYVLHLRYEIKGLGSVRLMFQAVDEDFQETWLQRVEIRGLEDFGDQTWASKLGISLNDGWKLNAGGDFYQVGTSYPDSKDRRYVKKALDGTSYLQFGHDPRNKEWPNMAQMVVDGPKRSNRPVTRRETNRVTKLLRMRRPEIEKELGKPISAKLGNSQETCVYNYPGTLGLTVTYYGQGTGTPNDIPGQMHASFAKGTTWEVATKALEITGTKLQAKPWAPVKGAFEIIGHRYWPHSFFFTPDNARYPDGALIDPRGLPQLSID